ncbi:MAG: glycosyltransferase family 9 protein [Proteobacteria bacterium]|nr:glycosyltransferase family 9 protein [Pseudomonadota bacterium]MCP4920662.1 glycosyltransferase family 9 protein [Pseudomonadota bacterium]
MHVYVRAPNHLGDGVMAEPTVRALAARHRVTVAAPGWGAVLYRELDVEVVPRGTVPAADAAVLLAPSFRAAWEARRIPVRVGISWDLRGWLLTESIPPGEGHRTREYADVAALLGVDVVGEPRFEACSDERAATVAPHGHVALVPVSPSGEVVMWPGFAELQRRLGGRAVAYTGPGESWPDGVELPLGELAAALEHASVVVVNDSGLSHFARAVGARVIVVHGSTAPGRTGALGSEPVEGPALDCRPCYAKRCRVGGVPCLDIPVERVEALL